MATPFSYKVRTTPNGGAGDWLKFPSFTAASDANAVSVAQQLATMYQQALFVIRSDNNTILNAGAALSPAAAGSALGNQITGVALTPL